MEGGGGGGGGGGVKWRYAIELFEFPNPVQCLPVMYVCMHVCMYVCVISFFFTSLCTSVCCWSMYRIGL